jgi:uncharacterized membrane protein required for colicin V production
MSINFDVICGTALIVGFILGCWTGIIGSFFYVISGFVGMLIADKFGYLFPVPHWVVFVCAMVVLIILGLVLRKVFATFLPGFIDSLLGGVLGVCLVLIVTSNILYLYDNFKGQKKMYVAITTSYCYKHFVEPWEVFVPPFAKMKHLKNGEYVNSILQEYGIHTQEITEKMVQSEQKIRSGVNDLENTGTSAVKKVKSVEKKEQS